MLMPALVLRAFPVDLIATMARTNAGMMQERPTKEPPQSTTAQMVKMRAHTAKPFFSYPGGGTEVTIAAVG